MTPTERGALLERSIERAERALLNAIRQVALAEAVPSLNGEEAVEWWRDSVRYWCRSLIDWHKTAAADAAENDVVTG